MLAKLNYRAVLLIWLGFLVFFDGVLSFIMYRGQSWYEQAFRVLRMAAAIGVVLLAPPTNIELIRRLRNLKC